VKVFIDSNIPMYVAGADHPNRDPARRFLEGVRSGEVTGFTSTEVLQEILYRYSAIGRRDLAAEVYDLFVQLCPVVFDVTLADTDGARQLLLDYPELAARDCVHAAVMRNHELSVIASFDTGFDRVAGIRRLDLQDLL
jgi:predicted nucleic acid-binding protein